MDVLGYFNPHRVNCPARARGCFTCARFHGRFLAANLDCEQRGGVRVIGTPKMGCAFWERGGG